MRFESVLPVTALIAVFGSGGNNTLAGPLLAGGQTWRIEGPDSGTMDIPDYITRHLRWRNMQTLLGNDAADTFHFTGGSVSGSIDGGGGFNKLFYDPPPTPFIVDLANGLAPLVGGTATNIQVVVPDKPGQPTLSINNVSLTEGNAGTKSFVFTVSLSSDPTSPVTVTVNSADGSATLADSDYQAITNVVLTLFPVDRSR